jgi:hypothetical protein
LDVGSGAFLSVAMESVGVLKIAFLKMALKAIAVFWGVFFGMISAAFAVVKFNYAMV